LAEGFPLDKFRLRFVLLLLFPHPEPFFLHEHPKGRNTSGIPFFIKNLMDLGICKPPAPEFYDIFLIGGQFAGNPCIIMAICNTIIRVQVILYGLTGMMQIPYLLNPDTSKV